MEGSVKQRGMQEEPTRLGPLVPAEHDVGEDHPVARPHPPQSLERGAVAVAARGESVVDAVEVDRARPGRRPHACEIGRPRGRAADRPNARDRGGVGILPGVDEDAGGVLRPGCPCAESVAGRRSVTRRVFGPGVDGQLAPTVGSGLADGHLKPYRPLERNDERHGERELLDEIAANLVARADGQFDEGRAGQYDRVEHTMIGEPRVSPQR